MGELLPPRLERGGQDRADLGWGPCRPSALVDLQGPVRDRSRQRLDERGPFACPVQERDQKRVEVVEHGGAEPETDVAFFSERPCTAPRRSPRGAQG